MSNEMIAVVDDDETMRKALSRLLGGEAYRVETYTGGQQFIDSLHGRVPECLILDMNMEPVSGGEVLKYLADTSNRIPTVILTGRDSPQRREDCRRAGVSAFLVKPVSVTVLTNAIQTALSEKLPH